MNICDSIKKRYIRLSKGQRKVAQFVLDNPNIIASQIASEVGRLAGVSESTVIRFCYAMDLSGFSDLQEKMKTHLIEIGEVPFVKQKAPKNKRELTNQVFANTVASVTKETSLIDEKVFGQAVQTMHKGQAIYIIGFRQATPVALWLFNELSMIRDQVYFIQHDAEEIARNLATMDEHSVLVTFMLGEEFEDVETVIAIAQRKNVKIITVCEQVASEMTQVTSSLSVQAICSQGIPCKVAIFSLVSALIECVVQQDTVNYEKNREKYKKKNNPIQLIAIS